jgi:hypothetical protein
MVGEPHHTTVCAPSGPSAFSRAVPVFDACDGKACARRSVMARRDVAFKARRLSNTSFIHVAGSEAIWGFSLIVKCLNTGLWPSGILLPAKDDDLMPLSLPGRRNRTGK